MHLPNRHLRVATLTVAVLLTAPLVAALSADNVPVDRVADGDFEDGAVSLRMPALGPFPLIAGGWGARGATEAALLVADAGGDHAAEVESRPTAPVHLIQDVPVATRSFRLRLEIMRLRGRQTLKLVSGWDRLDPATVAPELAIRLGANSLRVDTSTDSWRVERGLSRRRWVELELVSDTRNGLLEVYIDGTLVAGLPGLPRTAPQTLILGPGAEDGPSRYRYDSVSLVRTAEVELASLRRLALRAAPAAMLPHVGARLDAAAAALTRGADTLAVPELRAAGRLLERATATSDPEVASRRRDLIAGLAALVDLLQRP